MEALILVAEGGGPTMFAWIGMLRALRSSTQSEKSRALGPAQAEERPMTPRFEIKIRLRSIPKASILLRGRLNVRQLVVTENRRNEFVVHNFLHHKSHKLGAGDSAFLCCLL